MTENSAYLSKVRKKDTKNQIISRPEFDPSQRQFLSFFQTEPDSNVTQLVQSPIR